MTKPLDNLPIDLLLQLSRQSLAGEIVRLRNVLKDSQRANQSKRKKVQNFRRALRTQHTNFKSLVAQIEPPSSEVS